MSIENRSSDRLEALRRTIDEGLVTAVYQPIVDLERAGICAFEALTRTAPGSAFSNPAELFDAAEDLGMLWDLEMVTRRQTFRQAADWPGGVLLFLNCTPQVIADERFADTILAEVAETPGLSPRRIVLEVTERSESQHVEGLHRQTTKLQKHGFQLAIDDVGAGTSGLNRIMLLRPQWLKLDRELVAGIDRDPVRTNLVRFLAHFAKLSGVSIIGEGVEREAELEQLIRLNVNCVQGYLLGKPGLHDQQLPESMVDRIRSASKAAGASPFAGEHANQLARLMRPAFTAESLRPVADVAEDLLKQPAVRGVVVTDGGYYAGWCSRDRICSESSSGANLLDIAGPAGRTLRLGMTIDGALDIAAVCCRDGELDRPLVVAESGRVMGVIEMRDLISAAAETCRAVQHRVAPLTGLPGRVRCEQALEEAISEGRAIDAAFIDLRGLADYNAVFGFELGDDLIRQLVDVIGQVVQECSGREDDAFLGHLGDDRLLLMVRPGLIDGIARDVVRLFQTRLQSSGISPRAALSGLGVRSATATVALRFLAVRDVAAHYDGAQSFMRTEATLRALADEDAAINPEQPGYVVVIDPEPLPATLRLAA